MTMATIGKLMLALAAATGAIIVLDYPQTNQWDAYLAVAGIVLGAIGGVLQPQPSQPAPAKKAP